VLPGEFDRDGAFYTFVLRICFTQLYTRHLYALINSVPSLSCWVPLTEGAMNELLFWHGLPRTIFEGDIWPPTEGISIRMESDANNIGWGGTPWRTPHYLLENISLRRRVPSLLIAYREMLGVFRCLYAMVHLCEGKFVVF
jgi:hypothetical protein